MTDLLDYDDYKSDDLPMWFFLIVGLLCFVISYFIIILVYFNN